MIEAPMLRPGEAFTQLYRESSVLVPGVFNPISALSAANAGAKALYISGAGVTNANLGVPDIALAGLDDFVRTAAAICRVVRVPVIADADTGFGDVHNVRKTVIEMEQAGLAGIHIEDQASPKRCGHLDGKSLVEAEQMVQKVVAATEARRDQSFHIIARTDARGVEGLEEAVRRAKLYAAAGADMIFPEGLTSEDEFKRFRDEVDAPLLANMTEFGKTPLIPFQRFSEIGYEITIYPMTGFRLMLKALDEGFAELLASGSQAGLIEKMRTRQELYAALEYKKYEQADAKIAEKAQSLSRSIG